MALQLVHVGELYDTGKYGQYSAIDEIIPTADGGYKVIFERQTFKDDETRIDEDLIATVGPTGMQSGPLLKLAEDLRFENSKLLADGSLMVWFGMRTNITIGTLGADGVVKTLYDTEVTQIMEPPMSTSDGGVAYGTSGSIAVARIDQDSIGKFRAVDILGTDLKVKKTLILDRDLRTDEAGSTIVTALSDGRFLVTWVEVAEGKADVVARVVTAAGKVAGQKFVVGTVDDGSQPFLRYEVAALPDGAFALSYQGQTVRSFDPITGSNSAAKNLKGTTWIPDGANDFKSSGQLHQDAEFKFDDLISLIALSDGRMVQVVEYSNQEVGINSEGPDFLIRAHVYDAKGNYSGEFLDLLQYKYGSGAYWDVPGRLRAVALEDGRFALVTDFSDADGAHSTAQIYSLSSSPLALVRGATSGNDILKGNVRTDLAERIDGGSGDDQLFGYGGSDKLYGGDGKDLLDGGKGADTLVGGRGSDIYLVDRFDDIVFENRQSGVDTVRSSIDYALGQNVEKLILTGTAAIGGRGNALDNHLTGNGAANRLDGGEGADVMQGFGGNDAYHVDNARDQVIEAAGNGTDTVLTTVSFRLTESQSIEVVKVDPYKATSGQTIELTGNSRPNTLIGGYGVDVINGREGADTLSGSYWADIFVFDTALGKGNIDRITDFATLDTIQLDDAIFRGLAPGRLAETAFKDVSKGRIDADDRIIYNPATGNLAYDSDGKGSAKAIVFATLGEVGSKLEPVVYFHDFWIV